MIPELQIDTEATVREFSYETAEVAVMKYAYKIMKSKSTLGKLAAMMMMIITFFFYSSVKQGRLSVHESYDRPGPLVNSVYT